MGLFFGFGIKGGQVPGGRSVCRTRAFVVGLLVLTLFNFTVIYSYLVAPDWMFMYFLKAETIPPWMIGYTLLFYYLVFIFGFFLKTELGKIHPILPWMALGISFLGTVGVILPLKKQYLTVTTFEQFHNTGVGLALSQSPVGEIPAYLTPVILMAALLGLLWSRRQQFS